jgi:hypothetical protein
MLIYINIMNLCLIHRGRLRVRIVQIHLTEDTEDGWLSMLQEYITNKKQLLFTIN